MCSILRGQYGLRQLTSPKGMLKKLRPYSLVLFISSWLLFRLPSGHSLCFPGLLFGQLSCLFRQNLRYCQFRLLFSILLIFVRSLKHAV